jgi:hypothetical protein
MEEREKKNVNLMKLTLSLIEFNHSNVHTYYLQQYYFSIFLFCAQHVVHIIVQKPHENYCIIKLQKEKNFIYYTIQSWKHWCCMLEMNREMGREKIKMQFSALLIFNFFFTNFSLLLFVLLHAIILIFSSILFHIFSYNFHFIIIIIQSFSNSCV